MRDNSNFGAFGLILTITIIGAVVGAAYTSIVYLSDPNAEGSIWSGMLTGIIISALSSSFEIFFVSHPRSRIRKLPFLKSLAIRELVHLTIIIGTFILVQSVFHMLTGSPIFVFEQEFKHTAYDLIFSFIIMTTVISLFQIKSFIGGKTLRKLLLGQYNRPQVENRIFMIIDVEGSTRAAETIGDEKFHRFLNDLFILFDDPIHKYGGEVHSYVGDAIIAVWPLEEKKSANARVFAALRAIRTICEQNAAKTQDEFGIVPKVHAAIHSGPIAMGEMGFRKRQITYLGNTLNQTFRLEALAKDREAEDGIVVSASLLDHVDLPDHLTVTPLGAKSLKGVAETLEVSSIQLNAISQAA